MPAITMNKPVADVNFSDHSVRPRDPHRWREDTADIIYQRRLLYSVPVWLCRMCHTVSTIPPLLMRRTDDDFPTCITTWP